MRGVVLDIKRRAGKSRFVYNARYFLRRWGLASGFVLLVAAGLAAGCRLSAQLGDDTLGRLDFLFVTNLPERLGGGFAGVFAASFASDFLFISAAFLMGLCPWGAPALIALAFFKGFGVGVSAGYLILMYGFGGMWFYLLVLLPGMLVFTAALVVQLCASCEVYRRMMIVLFCGRGAGFGDHLRLYLRKSAAALLLSLGAAAADSLLWIALAGVLNPT